MKNIIDLLGKEATFLVQYSYGTHEVSGCITEVVLALDGEHSIGIDGSDFYTLSELLEFQIA